MKTELLENIHESLVNGQRKQMVRQIDDYGLYDFFDDYAGYLYDLYSITSAYDYLRDAASSYHRITNR